MRSSSGSGSIKFIDFKNLMSVSKDIPIKVVNETSSTSGVKVVIFAKNINALDSYHWPWQILSLSAPGVAEALLYPAETSLEARWSGISRYPLLVGPFPVQSGSMWEILQPEERGTPALQQG